MANSRGKIVGAASLLWWRRELVLEVQKPEKWTEVGQGLVQVGIGGVGGGLEGRETAVDALQREAVEEIGCRLDLNDAPATYAVTPDRQVLEERWCVPGVRPVLVWEACLPGLVRGQRVAVFRGRPTADPFPADLPALLLVTPSLLFAIGRGGMCLGEAREQGAGLRARIAVPDTARLTLVGTPAVLNLLKLEGKPVADSLCEPLID